MTMTATGAAPRQPKGIGWGTAFLLALALLLAFWLAVGLPDGPVETMPAGNDAGMRLLTLRDLMAGQGWFDATQARLGPDGTVMHWSRLVDAPMLATILALEPVLGRAGAEAALLWLWPLVMLALVLATAAAIARRLGGPMAAGLTLGGGLLMLTTRWRFGPGDIDHHNVQAALLLLALWGVLARRDARLAAPGAGLAIAASLCVGVETLPLLAVLGVAVAALWAAGGMAERGPALGFAAGLGGGLAVLMPLTAPPGAWAGGFCDAISVDLAGPVVGGAALLAGLAAVLSARSRAVRAGALMLGAAALGVAVLAVRPTCLSNPYDALDPYVVENWLRHTTEAMGLVERIAGGARQLLVLALAALAAAVALPLTAGRRAVLPAALILLGLAISLYQVRGMLVVAILTLTALAVTAAILRRRSVEMPGRGAAAKAAAALLALSLVSVLLGFGSSLILRPFQSFALDPDAPSCSEAGAFDTLAALEPGLVAASSNLGVRVLLSTPHRVLAAPYHRNEVGLRLSLEAMLARTDAEAERALRASGADYVVACPSEGDAGLYAREVGEDILVARLSRGEVPAFLVPVPGTEDAAARVFTLR